MVFRNLSGTVDFTVLENMTGGLSDVTLEVLDLYAQQVALWTPLLDVSHDGWRDALHTLRGASLGIGAKLVASACAEAETLSSDQAVPAVARVISALNQALSDVAIYRHKILIDSLKG